MRYPDRERRRISALRRRRPELTEALSFLERVTEVAERLSAGPRSPKIEPADGSPPLAPRRFPLDDAAASQTFELVLKALADVTESAAVREALAAVADGRLEPRRLARAYCEGDERVFEQLALNHSAIEPEFLRQLAELAVKPQFVMAAQAAGTRVVKPTDGSDRCPWCGSAPELAMIVDERDAEGAMHAVCRLCESEWPVKRVRCLHCGNENSEELSYLRTEDDDRVRVNVCGRCRRYLPIVDVRGRLEVAPAVERVVVTDLELLAVQQGWEPLAGVGANGGTLPCPSQ